MSLPLDLRFTDPAAPLLIDIEGDNCETIFVISTSLVHGPDAQENQRRHTNAPKRKRDTAGGAPLEKARKPMKAVQRTNLGAASSVLDIHSRIQSRAPDSMPPSSFIPPPPKVWTPQRNRVPLFLPESSQSSIGNEEALRASG